MPMQNLLCLAAGECIVSEWGVFTPCSRTGLDRWVHSHSRVVQQPAADCPDDLTETLTCGEHTGLSRCSLGATHAGHASCQDCQLAVLLDWWAVTLEHHPNRAQPLLQAVSYTDRLATVQRPFHCSQCWLLAAFCPLD